MDIAALVTVAGSFLGLAELLGASSKIATAHACSGCRGEWGKIMVHVQFSTAETGADPGGVEWVSSHPPMGYIVDAND